MSPVGSDHPGGAIAPPDPTSPKKGFNGTVRYLQSITKNESDEKSPFEFFFHELHKIVNLTLDLPCHAAGKAGWLFPIICVKDRRVGYSHEAGKAGMPQFLKISSK